MSQNNEHDKQTDFCTANNDTFTRHLMSGIHIT